MSWLTHIVIEHSRSLWMLKKLEELKDACAEKYGAEYGGPGTDWYKKCCEESSESDKQTEPETGSQ